MRVHLIARRPRREGGAVAVVTALLMVVVVGLGAFTVDLGVAYADTRQLQVSADAAALAAANVLRGQTGTCTTLVAGAQGAARTAADQIRDQNRPGSTRAAYSVACTGDGSVEVTYASTGSTPTYLAGVFGQSGGYTTTRTARARLSALGGGIIRPYAVCGSQLAEAPAGTVLQMDLPAPGNSACPGVANPGNWWSIDCPEVGSNSNAYMATTTLSGCASPVTVVPDQLTSPPRTPTELRTHLESSCTVRSSSCLSANSGQIGGNPLLDAWDVLVSEQRRIVLPVFCGNQPSGPCDMAAVVNAGGNNAIYPVHALVGVQICAYHFGNQRNPTGTGTLTGECASHNPNGLTTATGGPQDNYILMRVVDIATLQTSGTSACPLGSPCDLQRNVFLVE